MKSLVLLGIVVVILCLAMGSVTIAADDDPAMTPMTMQGMHNDSAASVPVTTSASGDQAKIILIVLGIHKDNVALESVEIRYGHPPNIGYQNGNFTVTIRTQNGTPLFTFDVWDPRSQVEAYGFRNELERHEQMENQSLEQGYRDLGEGDDVDLPLILPYHRDIHTVDLVDKRDGSLLISVAISPAVDTFRSRFPKDPDMTGNPHSEIRGIKPPRGDLTGFLAVSCGLGIILMVMIFHLVRRS
jgi:hypothetical protein